VQVDVLRRNGDGWDLIEVKSSTKVKPEHLTDCAAQAWVLQANGLDIRKIYVAHINADWTYCAPGDYRGLLKPVDVTNEVLALIPQVPGWISSGMRILSGGEPPKTIGKHCRVPYGCEHFAHCGKNDAEYPVHELPRGGELSDALYNEGIMDIRDVPVERLNTLQRAVQVVLKTGQPLVTSQLQNELRSISYPRYFLDFETLSLAVPFWLGTKPFEQVPFQWSCHVQQSRNAALQHFEFLAEGDANPREQFIETLIESLSEAGSIIVYSGFEKMILSQCAVKFPIHKVRIDRVIERLVDILPIVRKGYIHPRLHGSWSIKKVLPSLSSEVSYSGAEVADGGAAQRAYQEIIVDRASPNAVKKRSALLHYCKTDTLAMVAVLRGLTIQG